MHKESFEEMGRIIKSLLGDQANLKVLDVGSQDVQKGKQPTYRDLMKEDWVYTGCDLSEGPNVDVVQPGPYELPFDTGTFDLVISGNCIEHVEYPIKLVQEMARVLKWGHMLIVGAPYMMKHHRFPLDCWRFLPDGMAILFRDAGFSAIATWIEAMDCYGTGVKGAC